MLDKIAQVPAASVEDIKEYLFIIIIIVILFFSRKGKRIVRGEGRAVEGREGRVEGREGSGSGRGKGKGEEWEGEEGRKRGKPLCECNFYFLLWILFCMRLKKVSYTKGLIIL